MYDAIVVGAGLFGQITAQALREQGRNVLVIDDRRPEAGSLASACLMKPSWFSSMGKHVTTPSLDLLDELYGLKTLSFKTRPKLLDVSVHWCDPAKILAGPFQRGRVKRVFSGGVELEDGEELHATTIVVAAGIWTERLVPQVKQRGQKGAAFVIPSLKIKDPFIWPYAPYRQLVAFNRGDGAWIGDGTAILEKNWTDDHLARSWSRMEKAVQAPVPASKARVLVGIRPYAKGAKPCVLANYGTSGRPIYAATGGAKNGTIAAGWCAHTIRGRTS